MQISHLVQVISSDFFAGLENKLSSPEQIVSIIDKTNNRKKYFSDEHTIKTLGDQSH